MNTTATDAIRKTVLVDLAPAEAFDLFTAGIARWWPVRTHSYGGDAVTDVVFEAHVGGRVQHVELTDTSGVSWTAVYLMEHEADGAWRIEGCVLARSGGTAI